MHCGYIRKKEGARNVNFPIIVSYPFLKLVQSIQNHSVLANRNSFGTRLSRVSCAIESFDIAVLCWTSEPRVQDVGVISLAPVLEFVRDIFRSIVTSDNKNNIARQDRQGLAWRFFTQRSFTFPNSRSQISSFR